MFDTYLLENDRKFKNGDYSYTNMNTDKELLRYFYQERNIKPLESLIDELPDAKEHSTSDDSDIITDIKEAQHLLDTIAYPRVQELIPAENVAKPELRLYDNRLFQRNTNRLLAKRMMREAIYSGALWGSSLGALGIMGGLAIYDQRPDAPLLLGTAGVVVGTVAGSLLSLPMSLLTHKAENVITAGLAERKNNIIYVKSGRRYDETLHTLAHEITHRFTEQLSPKRMKQPYINEGLAEAVAFEVNRLSADEIDSSYVFDTERDKLIDAYQNLCGKIKIKKENRKNYNGEEDFLLRLMKRLTRKERAPYHTGYAAIRLMQEERGIGVFREIVE